MPPAPLLAIALVAAVAAGCAGRIDVPWPPAAGVVLKPVWLVQHGWHTRVAVRRADVDQSLWPASRELGDVTFLEVGWGDRDFYPKDDPSIADAIDPVVRPTPAALHVGGFDRAPSNWMPEDRVALVRVPVAGFDELTRFVNAHHVYDDAGRPVRIRAGNYPRSWFYLATGRYHALFNNSNAWTAKALRAAGAPLTGWAVTASGVMAEAREVGRLEPRESGVEPATD